MKSITIDKENNYFTFENGVLFDINKTKILSYLQTNTNESYIIPDGIKQIGIRSFSSIPNLISITISSTVETIEGSSFSESPNLITVTYKGDKEPSTCATNAFSGCPKLSVINVPSNYEGTTFCGKQVTKQST